MELEGDDKGLKSPTDTKLTKLADAANKKMKKLRRNWSLKKNDISKGWSRIRKYSNTSMLTPPSRPSMITVNNQSSSRMSKGQVLTSTAGTTMIPDTKSVVRHHGGPVVGDGSSGDNDTTFYITLTIEQDDDDDDPLERIDGKNLEKYPPVF
jgi:hypothetical protein